MGRWSARPSDGETGSVAGPDVPGRVRGRVKGGAALFAEEVAPTATVGLLPLSATALHTGPDAARVFGRQRDAGLYGPDQAILPDAVAVPAAGDLTGAPPGRPGAFHPQSTAQVCGDRKPEPAAAIRAGVGRTDREAHALGVAGRDRRRRHRPAPRNRGGRRGRAAFGPKGFGRAGLLANGDPAHTGAGHLRTFARPRSAERDGAGGLHAGAADQRSTQRRASLRIRACPQPQRQDRAHLLRPAAWPVRGRGGAAIPPAPKGECLLAARL